MNRNKITLFNIASTMILQGLAFFSGPFFSSMLGTYNYGISAVYSTWVQIASIVFTLQAAGMIGVARTCFSDGEQKQYQSSVLSLATISYFCFSIVTISIVILIAKSTDISVFMVIFGLMQGWGLYCVYSVNGIFLFEFNAGKNFTLTVITSILTIGASIVLVYAFPKEENYWGIIIGQSVVYTGLGFFLFVYIYKLGKTFYSLEYWKFTIPLVIPTIFHLLAYLALNQSDKIMLQSLIGNSSAGIYSLACTFCAVLNVIYVALNKSWTPFYYEFTKENQINEIRIHAKNYVELFTIITIGFIFLSREVFHIYADRNFWDGTNLIPIFSISSYFIFLYSFPVNYEFYYKKTKAIAIGTLLAAGCNIFLNYILIGAFGIIGAAFATACSHCLQFLFHYFCAKRIKGKIFPYKSIDFSFGAIAVLLSCLIFYATEYLLLIRWGVSVLLGTSLLIKICRRREIF